MDALDVLTDEFACKLLVIVFCAIVVLPPTKALFATFKPIPEPWAIKRPLMFAWPALVRPNCELEK